MPECDNCGNCVSESYARVMWERDDKVPACPECDDAKINNGEKYEYRNS